MASSCLDTFGSYLGTLPGGAEGAKEYCECTEKGGEAAEACSDKLLGSFCEANAGVGGLVKDPKAYCQCVLKNVQGFGVSTPGSVNDVSNWMMECLNAANSGKKSSSGSASSSSPDSSGGGLSTAALAGIISGGVVLLLLLIYCLLPRKRIVRRQKESKSIVDEGVEKIHLQRGGEESGLYTPEYVYHQQKQEQAMVDYNVGVVLHQAGVEQVSKKSRCEWENQT